MHFPKVAAPVTEPRWSVDREAYGVVPPKGSSRIMPINNNITGLIKAAGPHQKNLIKNIILTVFIFIYTY